jgi:hypothetical protein
LNLVLDVTASITYDDSLDQVTDSGFVNEYQDVADLDMVPLTLEPLLLGMLQFCLVAFYITFPRQIW